MNMINFIELLNELNNHHLTMMEYQDSVWSFHSCDNSVSWNTENNKEDMENGDGETYGGEVFDGITKIGGYTLMNVDNGCGERVTMIFNNDKEIVDDE